jgi:hypothetical protein
MYIQIGPIEITTGAGHVLIRWADDHPVRGYASVALAPKKVRQRLAESDDWMNKQRAEDLGAALVLLPEIEHPEPLVLKPGDRTAEETGAILSFGYMSLTPAPAPLTRHDATRII